MNRQEVERWLSHLTRCKSPQHDDKPDLTDQLIKRGLVTVVKVWTYQGKPCRIVQAKV